MEHPNELPPKRFYIFVFFLLIICIYLGASILLGKPIAVYKSKNPKNILEGCLYYEGVNFKSNQIGSINDEIVSLGRTHIQSFPASKKKHVIPYFDYSKSNHCYKVKYIIVDFNIFTNHSFFRSYYIYDYVDY